MKQGDHQTKLGMHSLKTKEIRGTDLYFTAKKLHVILEDEREIAVPFSWFPRLLNPTEAQLSNWRWIAGGIGIHWEELDEDILVSKLFGVNG